LRRYIKWGEGITPPLEKLIRRRTVSLPEIVQREVHWKVPDNALLDSGKIPPYYDGDHDIPLNPVVSQALEAYDAAIREAVERDSEERSEASDFWEKARELEVKVFDDDGSKGDA
jgi:hypothetical protein